MTSGANCQTFTSSTVISYSNLGDGPKVYQETSEMRSAPGGVRRRPQCVIPAGGCWFCWGRVEFHWWLSVGHPQHFCFAVNCGLRNVLWVTEPCWAPLRGDGKCQLERKSLFPYYYVAFDWDWWQAQHDLSTVGKNQSVLLGWGSELKCWLPNLPSDPWD